MKKRVCLLAISLISALAVCAQSFNCTLRDNLDYTEELSDVWGYVAPDGTEYALVGLFDGLSIVSLADPDDIEELHFIPGDESIWRDIKTFGDYAYVVADTGDDGLLIVDLSGLPASVSHQYFNLNPPGPGVLNQAHNIYIDESLGYAFIAGANVNSGGMLIYDVATTPGTAGFVALGPNVYAHDVYVDNNLMYASEIGVGNLSIYNISNPNNITLEGSVITPFAFTHNAWSTTNNQTVFTTDERANASVAAYDISDLSNPVLLDEFRPQRSLNTGAIPHNVHVLGDYLIISSYTDGIEIVDASVPDQMVEVGFFDTWPGQDGGFNGTWGAYPFLPSGLVLGTDISTGLYVVEVDYQIAGRISGLVTDASSGDPINGAQVQLATPAGVSDLSQADGSYALGSAEFGTFVLSCTSAGYEDFSITLTLDSGDQLDQPIELVPLSSFSVSGRVVEASIGAPIDDAEVRIENENGEFIASTNSEGNFSLSSVFSGEYDLISSKWGFENEGENVTIDPGTILNRTMNRGYLDGFYGDQGWTSGGDATTGDWVRAIPIETSSSGSVANPGQDAAGSRDIGSYAYVTGNGGGTVGTDDIDGGTVTLTSPIIDLTLFQSNDLVVSYQYWFFNGFGNGAPDDELTIAIDNGSDQQVMKTYTVDDNTSQWIADSLFFNDLSIPITSEMRIVVSSFDLGNANVVEAGFDDFRIGQNTTALPVEWAAFELRPTDSGIWLDWQTSTESGNSYFEVERASVNGVFSRIGRVEGAGFSEERTSYQFFDAEPLSGFNLYRIKQVDVDGTFTYSRLLDHYWGNEDDPVSLFPNPAIDWVEIDVEDDVEIEIYDQLGKWIQSSFVRDGKIDVRSMPSGIYLIRTKESSFKLVKR
ncbi:MAG: choice-of-anchor B family protein [Bacteroidota bacterium]